MDWRAFNDAFAITAIAGASSILVAAADSTTADTTSMFSSLGVFGAALAIAYFMLKRGDRRETDLMQHAREDAMAAQKSVMQALAMVTRLQAEVDELRRNR